MGTPFTTRLGQESDASTLSSIITDAFAASDAAYKVIWGSTAPGTHEAVATKGLFTPLQKDRRITYVAVDASEKIVGFATWELPKEKAASNGKEGGIPDIPGVNMALFKEKLSGLDEAKSRDFNPANDFSLLLCFVRPEYQRQGVGSLLLQWGIKKADEQEADIWLTSTPQAVRTYQTNGWELREIHALDLSKHGGNGFYNRSWMVRPAKIMHEMG